MRKENNRNDSADLTKRLTIFIDGAGARPDGSGSAVSWLCTTTGEKRIDQIPSLTNNQAEYRALLSALMGLEQGSQAEIFSDSQLLCYQFSGEYAVHDENLANLLEQA